MAEVAASSDARERWIENLGTRVRGQTGLRPEVGRHVLERLATLLGLSEVVWVDSSVRHDRNVMRGQIAAFTNDLVAVVDVDGVEGPSPFIASTREQGTTRVRLCARAGLRLLDMSCEEGEYENSARAWNATEIPSGGGWPYKGRVTLHYSTMDVPLRLPFDDTDSAGFAAFLPDLVTDLTK